MRDPDYEWIPFYEHFADALLEYSDDRNSLIEKLKEIYHSLQLKFPIAFRDGDYFDIDPFTIYAFFTKDIKTENKFKLMREMIVAFDLNAPVPTDLAGIPRVNNVTAIFYNRNNEGEIQSYWDLLVAALQYDQDKTTISKFIKSFDTAYRLREDRPTELTKGLFWIRPHQFMSLDPRNRGLLSNSNYFSHDFTRFVSQRLGENIRGYDYVLFLEKLHNEIDRNEFFSSFPDITFHSWETMVQREKSKKR